MKTKTILYLIAFVVFIGLLLSWNRIFPHKPSSPSQTQLPGMQTGAAPWQPEITHLAERLQAIGLPALSAEGSALHLHQHLDIFIDGKAVPVPADIGINEAAGFISDIHVHDNSGIIHIESPDVRAFTLGQFFDVWGVRFTTQCIGGYCASEDKALKVYMNGALYQGDPRQLPLAAHQEIVIVYGSPSETPNPVPSSFVFPTGY